MCLYSVFVISTKGTFWPSKPTHPQNRQPSAFIVATRHSSKTQHGWIHLLALHAMFALCRRLTGNWDKSSIFSHSAWLPSCKNTNFWANSLKNSHICFGGLSWLKFLNFKVKIMDQTAFFCFRPIFFNPSRLLALFDLGLCQALRQICLRKTSRILCFRDLQSLAAQGHRTENRANFWPLYGCFQE